ncbi:MAG TPA: GNAT family N-acetyltransferase [Pseudonocardia sp.]|uniref:GNAT family N-acetyltransferase n=1 Tax=Pseudonocardia sp. TaxID=60912 RepID=UPI002B4B328D|nr:GNAT family N-acetyltransferase [Pseudonocardia sp.]HLU56296.1 GNAT family N-acetyltransferase [Pseudonocardia sp.]
MIRPARPADVPTVVRLVHELAEYERSPELCTLTEEQLHAAVFGPDAVAGCHVAEADGEVVGCAIWFRNFSTWRGVPGIYLEDLFVRPSHRGRGLGKALLAALAAICAERGYGRLEWQVLDWNEPSIGFYKSLGAVPMDEWTTFRLDGDALAAFALERRG